MLLEHFNKLFNIDQLGKSKITLITAILLFYMATSGTITDSLLSKRLNELLSDNRYAQHTAGFLRMFVTIVLVSGINDTRTALLYSIIAYIWFMLTTKLDLEWNVLILSLLLLGFVYENNITAEETKFEKDEVLMEIDKKKLYKRNRQYKTYIVLSIVTLTLIGTILYYNKKTDQYGGDFNLGVFLFSGANKN